MMPSAIKPVVRRRYAPKNRGGCVTCKERHLRCDQGRPRCGACRKSSRQCAYASDLDDGVDHGGCGKSGIKVILWEPAELKLSLRRLAHLPGHTAEEHRALKYFRDVVAERLAGYFDPSFWTGLAFQMAQSVASLRHAMIALAAHWEHIVVPASGQRSIAPGWECDTFALQQYTLAIVEMRKSMESSTTSRSSTVELLMTNLLFICLEMFQNHYESALRQLSSGLYLFCEWQQDDREKDHPADHARFSDDLEVELARIFRRLQVQSYMFPASRIDKRLLVPTMAQNLVRLPDRFQTLEEARNTFNDCVASIFIDLKGVTSCNPSPPLSASASASEEGQGAGSREGELAYLHEWTALFQEFQTREDQNLTLNERRNCLILEIQRVTALILAVAPRSAPETYYDSWGQAFSKIITMVLYIIETKPCSVPNGRVLHYPKFDIALILPTYLVASRCRDPVLRRQAINLLMRGPRQEGLWNGFMLAAVAQRIVAVEEEGIKIVKKCQDVPAHARVKLIDATIITAHRRVEAIFSRPCVDGPEKVETFREMISYTC